MTTKIQDFQVEYRPAEGVPTTVQSKLQEFVSVLDFGAVGDGVTDDTAAIQAAIDSLPLNTASVGELTPKGFANGGAVFIPRGRYRVTSRINLRRGLRLVGESSEASQIVSFVSSDSVFQYADAGRYITDEIVFENLSIWQDASVVATAGAAIDIIHGPATVDAVKLVIKNVYIEKTYRGIRLSAAIGASIDSVQVNGAVTEGFYFVPLSDGGVTNTSTVFNNCYAYLCGTSGYKFGAGAYIALVGCASDSNAEYGYDFRNTISNNLTACGAEGNALGGARFSACESAVVQLFVIGTTAGTHGVVVSNSQQITLMGGYLNGTGAGAGGFGVNIAVAGGKVSVIGTQFLGDYADAKQCNTRASYLNLTDTGSLVGQKNRWALGNVSTPDTDSTFQVSGIADTTVNYTFKVNQIMTGTSGPRNAGQFVQVTTDNTAVTYPLVTSVFIGNIGKGAASTITRSAGAYIQEHTRGSTANANIMIDAGAGTVPAGDWNIYSDSTKASYLKGKMTWVPPSSGNAANNGDFTILATSNTNLQLQLKGSDGVLRTINLTLA
jgi:hypothetical protein